MEETNPWLDASSGKHINKKSIKPVKDKDNDKSNDKGKDKEKDNFNKRDRIDAEKEKFGLLNINEINKKDNSIANFLSVLVDFSIPDASKEWAISHYGEEWFNVFCKDLEYLREDLESSNFFPSQEKMILLKFIFILRQAL